MQGQELLQSLWVATGETFYMVSISALVVILLGLPLGLLLVMTSPGNLLDSLQVNDGLRCTHKSNMIPINSESKIMFFGAS